MSNEEFTMLMSLKAVVEHCVRDPKWIVLVTPSDGDLANRLFQLLQGLVPTGTQTGGRTVLLPGRGRISICRVTQKVEGTGYTAMLFGWSRQGLLPSDEIALHEWRNVGIKLASFDETGRDLVVS
jgi:hypothetical protein